MKNIISYIILGFSLIGCTSTLKDNPITFTSDLSKCEQNTIEYEKEFRRLVDNNWKQYKLFKHEDLSCCYCIYLNEDKTLHSIQLKSVFCDTSNDSECVVFLKTAKQTIINAFANKNSKIQNNLPAHPAHFHLCFSSKAGNLIFKNTK